MAESNGVKVYEVKNGGGAVGCGKKKTPTVLSTEVDREGVLVIPLDYCVVFPSRRGSGSVFGYLTEGVIRLLITIVSV